MVMHNTAWHKNNRREVLHTLGRYFAILMIIALGVGFFSGLKVTREAMIRTAEAYIQQSNMYDFRLLTTLGLTEEDAVAIGKLDGIQAAEGAVNADFITNFENRKDVVLKAHSITEITDTLSITAGRLPLADNECVADSEYFTEEHIGKTITISDKNDEDTADSFVYREYTIVGLCKSVNYMYRTDRGTTKIADGSIDAFVYLLRGGFNQDYYNEIYVTLLNKDGVIYSAEYDQAVSAMKQPITDALKERASIRYSEIVGDANEKIAEGESEYEEGYAEYLAEREDAERELADAQGKLEDAKAEIEENEKKLSDGEEQIKESEKLYTESLAEYRKSLSDFEKKKAETLQTLQSNQDEIDANRKTVTGAMEQIEKSGVLVQYESLLDSKKTLEAALSQLEDKTGADYLAYKAQLEQVEQGIAQIASSGVVEQYNSLKENLAQIETAQTQLDAGRKAAEEQFASAEAQFASAKVRLDSAKKEIASYKAEIADGKVELEKGKAEYEDGLKKYNDSKIEAETAFADAEAELADARKELDDAREKVREIKEPVSIVLDRSKSTGYASFDNDSSIVEGISRIFPIFFILVAALVCSTTMARMVDEHRTQIGTLKALGYSNGAIAWKYMAYSGSAAVLGCVIGFLGGTKLFPYAIWHAYKMIYNFAEIRYVFDGKLALLMLAVSLACSVGATYAVCRTELAQVPAELMRPKAPKAGKRILLERIPILWRRVSFLHKVSIRNIMRYKKRLIMMLLGIGGCSALLLAGFGINDSVGNIAEDQFGKIMMYDYTITFPEDMTEEDISTFISETSDFLSECVFVNVDSYDVANGSGVQKVNVAASRTPDIVKVIGFQYDGQVVDFPDDGYAIISDRMAQTTDVGAGDTMTLTMNDTESYIVNIDGIFTNYAYNYMYMSGKTYESVFGKQCTYKTAYAKTNSDDLYGISAKLMKEHGASNVIVTEDTRSLVKNMMESLNYIIWLVIACAGALAFVVMYNLSNINITERQREIATIKVLGFFPNETYAYVFRENFVITLLSTIVGLPAGVLLHRFVMDQITVESISFNVRILPMSYLLAAAITFALTILVNLILLRKIDRIHMAESLKSIE